MPLIDEVEALRRAKRDCERDGWIWDASVFMTLKGSSPNEPGPRPHGSRAISRPCPYGASQRESGPITGRASES
jgi:hypothetical protein